MVAMILAFCMQITGINAVAFFSVQIFKGGKTDEAAQ